MAVLFPTPTTARVPFPSEPRFGCSSIRTGSVTPYWRWTEIARDHFHSVTHEVLVILRSRARKCHRGRGRRREALDASQDELIEEEGSRRKKGRRLVFGGEDNPDAIRIEVKPGDVVVVPAGVAHGLEDEDDEDDEDEGYDDETSDAFTDIEARDGYPFPRLPPKRRSRASSISSFSSTSSTSSSSTSSDEAGDGEREEGEAGPDASFELIGAYPVGSSAWDSCGPDTLSECAAAGDEGGVLPGRSGRGADPLRAGRRSNVPLRRAAV